MNAQDWAQVGGAVVAFAFGVFVLLRGPGAALRVGGLGVVLLAVGFGIGGIEGVDTSDIDWLEAAGGAAGTVLVTVALVVLSARGGRSG
jgi:hypothetical protein